MKTLVLRFVSYAILTVCVVAIIVLPASAEVRWTYENGVLTEIASATSGSTLWAFNLSNAGVLTKKTAGNGAQLDFRKAAMPEGAPDIVRFSGRGLFVENGTDVKELFMPETLTTIDSAACIRMKGLTNLVWSANITSIGDYAFRECTALKGELVIPSKMTAVPNFVDGCSLLTSVRLHPRVTSIAASAFSYCSSLTNVVGYDRCSLKSIGNSAFAYCGNLAWAFELGFATNSLGEVVSSQLANQCDVLQFDYAIPSIRLGPGFTYYPWRLNLEGKKLAYVEMGENIATCWESFNQKGVNPPITNVVIKYNGTFAFPDTLTVPGTSGSASRANPQTFCNLTTIREMTFGGWFTYTATASLNPFSGWTDLQARFFVSGTNDEANAFCSDVTKVTPWGFAAQADKDAYYARYGADAAEPHGITVAVANGLPRTYIVRVGGEPLEMRNMPYEDDLLTCTSTSLTCLTNGSRSVYVFTNVSDVAGVQLKKRITVKEMLLVGGGGGGGSLTGGGGGGGGVIYRNSDMILERLSILKIKAGAGGAGASSGDGTSGSPSTFDDGVPAEVLKAFGGGGGGGFFGKMRVSGSELGSGGGGSRRTATFKESGTDYTAGQGNPGGDSSATIGGGGGGGGWSQPGAAVQTGGYAGAGGEGMTNSITGVAQVYGSGGGGGTGNPSSGTVTIAAKGGTNAGDGAEHKAGDAGKPGVNGFGGGGGGGGYYSKTASAGGRGGNGVVILSVVEGGTAGQPAIAKNDIAITFPDNCTQPLVTVRLGGEPDTVYSASVRVSCGTGALAQAGTAFDCVREYAMVTNGQVLTYLTEFYPANGEEVYVKVEASAIGASDVAETNHGTAAGEVPAFVGHGGGAHIIHVRPGAKGRMNGQSWADAYTDFREAIKLLDANRRELWFCGDNEADSLTKTITTVAPATIRGGFTGLEDRLSDRPDSSRSRITGVSAYTPLTVNNADPLMVDGFVLTRGLYHGLYKTGAGDITVTNCIFDGNGIDGSEVSGRGLYIEGSASSTRATVAGCTFLRHYERDTNGAMGTLALASLAGATVSDCLFASNGVGGVTTAPFSVLNGRWGHWGSALAVAGVPVTVERCTFSANVGASLFINSGKAGGVVMLRGNCDGSVFRNCAWIGNNSVYSRDSGAYTDPEGGALVVRMDNADQVARVENCTFAWNFYSGSNSTAGVNVRAGTVAITNSICWGNACGTQKCWRPADLYVQNGARALVGYSRFAAPAECVVDAGGTLTLGPGVTYGDPLFVTSTNDLAACRTFGKSIKFTAAGASAISAFNIHLRGRVGYYDEHTGALVKFRGAKSPAIDAGDPVSDCACEPSVPGIGTNGKRINLGVYGNTPYATMTRIQGFHIRLR